VAQPLHTATWWWSYCAGGAAVGVAVTNGGSWLTAELRGSTTTAWLRGRALGCHRRLTTSKYCRLPFSRYEFIMPPPKRWCASDICLSVYLSDNVWRLSRTSGPPAACVALRPAGMARIGSSGPARLAWLKAAAARFCCRGRGYIVAASRTPC